MRALAVALPCLAVASCASPQNHLLEEVRTEDLGARHPERVKQPVASARNAGQRQPELFPGEDRTVAPRRPGQGGVAPGGERNSVQRAADGYQLNFDNANIADVVKAVLGDTLRLPYVVDPRVQGTVSLSTGRPVSRDELIKVLETALRLNNGNLIAEGGGYRVLPAGEAAAGEVSHVRTYRSGESMLPGFGVTVMPLRHVSAEAMLRLLDGFLARAGSARAEVSGNLLLIRGSARERESIAEIAETFDVDWMRGQSAGLFPLMHATPDDMINELNAVMQAEQASLTANMVRFQPVARLNALLVLSRRADQLRQVATWIRRLDKSSAAGHQLFVYQVENGKATEIADILNETFTGGGGSRRSSRRSEVAPGREVSQLATGSASRQQGPLTRSGDAVPVTIGQAQPAPATPRPAPVGSGGGGGGGAPGSASAPIDVRIVADDANNSLLIRATQSDYQKILGALRQIDKPPLQVLINATIAEVTLNDALRYGVQAYLKWNKGSVGYHPGPQELTLTPSFPGLNFLIGLASDPRLVLDALSNVTTVKVVSSPSLVVVDNQPATLKVGDEVPIATQQSQSTVDPNAPIINTIRFRETGVILKVTPRVNSSGLVTMDVEQEISQVAGRADGSPTGATLTPTISQRRIASTISVYSGQSVALGGLISEQNNNNRNSVPLLNKIPLIGDLVGKTEIERKRTELIVFIKPQVIRNSESASWVSEELRSRLKSMAFDQPPDTGWHGRPRPSSEAAHPRGQR